MTGYDNPRPTSQPTGSTDLVVARDDLITLDRMVSGPSGTLVSNRKGKQLTPLVDILDSANSKVNEAIGTSFGVFIGNYPQTYTNYNQYTAFNGQQYGIKTPSQGGPALPYAPTELDPANDANLKIYGDASQSFVREAVTIGQEELLADGSEVFPRIGDLSNGMIVPSGATHLRVSGGIYAMSPVASGVVADLTTTSATVGGVSVSLSIISLNDLNGRVSALETRADNSEDAINALESRTENLESRTENLELGSVILKPVHKSAAEHFANGKKGCILLGDSISHGAFAGDLYSNGYTRLLARAYNAKFGGGSYGFIPLLNQGTGSTLSQDIHNVNFNNASGGWQALEGIDGAGYLNGCAFKSTGVGNAISVQLPSFMRRAVIHYEQVTGGGTFTVGVNGVVVSTVNTNASANQFAAVEVAANDNNYGITIVSITTTTATPVTILGISWFSGVLEPVLQNFSQSGRRARYLSDSVITKVCENSQTIVFALGHNDHGETDESYISSVTNTVNFLISEALRCGVNVVVPDFCWSAPSSNWMRVLLKKLAAETGGAYIDFPRLLANADGSPADANRLIDELKLFVDGSHPNADGNEYVFSEIAKAMGLISSKKQVLENYDYWMSLPLTGGLENSVLPIPSAVKRTPSGVVVRLYVEYAPGNPFPVGTYTVSSTYALRSGIFGVQTATHPVMKLDGTAVIGGVAVATNGSIVLYVTSDATFNDIAFVGVA